MRADKEKVLGGFSFFFETLEARKRFVDYILAMENGKGITMKFHNEEA